MRKRNMATLAVVVLLITGTMILLFSSKSDGNMVSRGPVLVTPENLPAYLSGFAIVEDLPRKSSVHLKFGNLEYRVSKGNIERGVPDNPDITLVLPEGYIGKIGYGVCSALQEAIRNGELRIETAMSKAELLWKYKKMLKYRNCVGL